MQLLSRYLSLLCFSIFSHSIYRNNLGLFLRQFPFEAVAYHCMQWLYSYIFWVSWNKFCFNNVKCKLFSISLALETNTDATFLITHGYNYLLALMCSFFYSTLLCSYFLLHSIVQFPCFLLWMASIRTMCLDHHPGFESVRLEIANIYLFS